MGEKWYLVKMLVVAYLPNGSIKIKFWAELMSIYKNWQSCQKVINRK